MKTRFLKSIAALICLAPLAVAAASRPFTDGTKVGDSGGGVALYAGGQHQLAQFGTDLVIAYPEEGGAENTIRLGRSLDGGATWLPSVVVTRGYWINVDGASLAVGPDPVGGGRYRVHVAYAQFASSQGGPLYYTFATVDPAAGINGVGGFSAPVQVSGTAVASRPNAIVADALGGVHIAFEGTVDGVSGLRYTRSADYGATFAETATVLAEGAGSPAFATDAAGDVFLAFVTGPNTQVAKRTAGFSAFGTPVLVTASGRGEESIACSTDGTHVYVAWIDSTYHVARSANGGATWATVDGPAMGSLFGPSVATSGTGLVGLAFTNYNTAELSYTTSTDAGLTWSAPALVTRAPWGATLLLDASSKANIASVYDGFNAAQSAVYFSKEK